MIKIYFYSQPRHNINPVSYFDYEIDYFLKHNFKYNDNTTIHTYQILIIYALRAKVSQGLINIDQFELYMDDLKAEVLANGRFKSYQKDDQFELYLNNIIENSNQEIGK